ncbi:MAG: universal stress protein [candidate division Zixibacteria bacterium]|nr:universal stress protein [candidate division Zixibacteria bacterium]
MFKRLLVPLDGSPLAETILPAAAFLATHLEASVVLIHVIEPDAPSAVHGQRHLRTAGEAEAYLREVAMAAFPPEIRVETHVHAEKIDSVTKSIAAHVTEFGSELILMCTHGKGGAKRLLFGSNAQQIASLGEVPMLLFPATIGSPAPFAMNNLLVPLDGQPEHEHSLPIAADLARRCGAALHLVRVVHTYGDLSGPWVQSSRLLPGTTSRMLEMAVQEAQEYLDNLAKSLGQGQTPVTTEVLRGDPAQVIGEAAAVGGSDLIVVGTHGKIGTDAFWSGSVASKICLSCDTPLLLIPAAATKSDKKTAPETTS